MKLKGFDFRIWDTTSNAYLHNPSLTITHFKSAVYENAYSMEVGEVIDENKDEREILIGCLDNNRYKSVEIELWSSFCDKKGKRIYENDILLDSQGDRYVVSICDESRDWILLKLDLSPCCSLIEILQEGYVEVIGNIHENVELLKKESISTL